MRTGACTRTYFPCICNHLQGQHELAETLLLWVAPPRRHCLAGLMHDFLPFLCFAQYFFVLSNEIGGDSSAVLRVVEKEKSHRF